MPRTALAVALACFFALPAYADVSNSICRTGGLCSRTFAVEGTCSRAERAVIIETPWEDGPIEIVGTGISVNLRWWSPFRWLPGTWVQAFAGNSYQPDVMLWQDGQGSTTQFFGGYAFPFPGRMPDPPHVDLHVSCWWPGAFTARLIVYYRLKI